jgi:hypothetical protein
MSSTPPHDPELRDLLASLRVTQAARPTVREQGGLGSSQDERPHFAFVQEGESFRSPPLGQPHTVNSEGDTTLGGHPKLISTKGSTKRSNRDIIPGSLVKENVINTNRKESQFGNCVLV